MPGPLEAPLQILFLALLLSSKLDYNGLQDFLIHPSLIYSQFIGQEAFLILFPGRKRANSRLGAAILSTSPTRVRLLYGLLIFSSVKTSALTQAQLGSIHVAYVASQSNQTNAEFNVTPAIFGTIRNA